MNLSLTSINNAIHLAINNITTESIKSYESEHESASSLAESILNDVTRDAPGIKDYIYITY